MMTAHEITTLIVTNFTNGKGKLDWDAFSAIGTVGAVWFAIVQSGRQNRLERVRNRGTVNYLVGLFHSFDEIKLDEDTRSEEFAGFPFGAHEQVLAMIRTAREGLAAISVADMTEVGAIQWKALLSLALLDLEVAFTAGEISPWSSARESRYHIEEFLHQMRQLQGALEPWSIKATIRQSWRWAKSVGWKPA